MLDGENDLSNLAREVGGGGGLLNTVDDFWNGLLILHTRALVS